MKLVIRIKRDGTAQFIYSDECRSLLEQGEAKIERASHVEPGDPAKGQDPLKWYADLAPVSGPILGPFETRVTALLKEVEYLNEHVLMAR